MQKKKLRKAEVEQVLKKDSDEKSKDEDTRTRRTRRRGEQSIQ